MNQELVRGGEAVGEVLLVAAEAEQAELGDQLEPVHGQMRTGGRVAGQAIRRNRGFQRLAAADEGIRIGASAQVQDCAVDAAGASGGGELAQDRQPFGLGIDGDQALGTQADGPEHRF